MDVGGSLFMRPDGENRAYFKGVALRGARVAGQVDTEGVSVDGALDAQSLQVGSSLSLRSTDKNQ
jgi:hypothetical protein